MKILVMTFGVSGSLLVGRQNVEKNILKWLPSMDNLQIWADAQPITRHSSFGLGHLAKMMVEDAWVPKPHPRGLVL